MFLYIFEDGSFSQTADIPTPADYQAVEDGILDIITTDKDGMFVQCFPETVRINVHNNQ